MSDKERENPPKAYVMYKIDLLMDFSPLEGLNSLVTQFTGAKLKQTLPFSLTLFPETLQKLFIFTITEECLKHVTEAFTESVTIQHY